jgi:DNA polymerase-2
VIPIRCACPSEAADGGGTASQEERRAFLVHAYEDPRRDRLYLAGRLEDGRSFAAAEGRWRPSFHVYQADIPRCVPCLAGLSYTIAAPELEAFSGNEELALIRFPRYHDRTQAFKRLEQARIPSPDGDIKMPEAFLAERGAGLSLIIRGKSRPGRLVDRVFPDPEIFPDPAADPGAVSLGIASIDIETDTRNGSIRAVAAAFTDSRSLSGGPAAQTARWNGRSCVHLLQAGAAENGEAVNREAPAIRVHRDEASLLRAFIADIQAGDPDALTGWNLLDFDFPCLAGRCQALGLPFTLGRSSEGARYFASQGRRSAGAVVPGRQVLDALRIFRGGPQRALPGGPGFRSYTLEAVSQAVLGEGKLLASSGQDKIAELDRLYREDPVRFGQYCYRDAALVLRILQKTGLFRLTMERAALTGVFLDKAWTSVASFERIYGMELRKRSIAPPPAERERRVSGAAGGTVLQALPGFFANVGVFDFRSLYPTIIRTFNIDPLAAARSPAARRPIEAPNGARFSRDPGILPALIEGYFQSRRRALERGDATAAHVYKILMNSFYGVMGTPACRYGQSELAGAITSFARKWLLEAQDWFARRRLRVLYGDTDSLFVETGLGDGADYQTLHAWGTEQAGKFNRFLGERIAAEYGAASSLELRFEKAYRRFLIPPLRGPSRRSGGPQAVRGRAKGYGGCLLESDGSRRIEVKGMEAVRSDVTPLSRRFQLELLELVFSGAGEAELRGKVLEELKALRAGKLDRELVYRKRLSRPPETYTALTPPQVKAARVLGWKGRRGTVEFVWTAAGPEPVSHIRHPLDYDHYADSQILPLARSIAAALGWHTPWLPPKGRLRESWSRGQMELYTENR